MKNFKKIVFYFWVLVGVFPNFRNMRLKIFVELKFEIVFWTGGQNDEGFYLLRFIGESDLGIIFLNLCHVQK